MSYACHVQTDENSSQRPAKFFMEVNKRVHRVDLNTVLIAWCQSFTLGTKLKSIQLVCLAKSQFISEYVETWSASSSNLFFLLESIPKDAHSNHDGPAYPSRSLLFIKPLLSYSSSCFLTVTIFFSVQASFKQQVHDQQNKEKEIT